MEDKQPEQSRANNGGVIGPVDPPILFPERDCAIINLEQNAYLSSLAAKKVNFLSCRCSGCSTDSTLPVISSPADAALLNTAYDGSGGFKTSGNDLHWEVGIGTRDGPPTPYPASLPGTWALAQVVTTPPTSWVKSPPGFLNANWISNDPAGNQSTGSVDAYFRYWFNLASSVNPATFAITMKFYADNRVWEIYVNGVAQSTQTNGLGILPQQFPDLKPEDQEPDDQTPGFQKGREVQITLNNNWRRCDNEIIVQVRSPGGQMGFLAQNAVTAEIDASGCDCHCDCSAAPFPSIQPCVSVAWGDSPCDCLETDDVEVLIVTVCNCYSNVTFGGLSIGQILVTDMAGNPVPALPDGTPSVQVIPSGPICFGDIGPCKDKNHSTCVSREVVLRTRGAVGKDYRLAFSAICFNVCHQFQSEQCFTLKLCQD